MENRVISNDRSNFEYLLWNNIECLNGNYATGMQKYPKEIIWYSFAIQNA
jgi:hypothetical protein